MMAHKRTRTQTDHPVIGTPSDLPSSKLPTNGDALRLFWKIKCDNDCDNFKITDNTSAKTEAADQISDVWVRALGDRKSAPIINQKAVETKLKRLYDKAIELKKSKSKEIPVFQANL